MRRLGSIPSAPSNQLRFRVPRALSRAERCAGRAGTLQLAEPPERRVRTVPRNFPVSWPKPKLQLLDRIAQALYFLVSWSPVLLTVGWLGLMSGITSRFYEEDPTFRAIVRQGVVSTRTWVAQLALLQPGLQGQQTTSTVLPVAAKSPGRTLYPEIPPVNDSDIQALGNGQMYPAYHKFKGLPKLRVTHVVGKGDTLSVIASDVHRSFGPISVEELEEQTGVKARDLRPGMTLTFHVRPWVEFALKVNGQSS